MNFRLIPEGILFEYKGDILVRHWPWRSVSGGGRYYSKRLDIEVNSFQEYWKKIGILEASLSLTSKLSSFSWEEILKLWLGENLNLGVFVVLYDLDLSKKSSEFWARVPPEKRVHFNEDVIIMRCKDTYQASDIADSIAPNFGKAIVIENGRIL